MPFLYFYEDAQKKLNTKQAAPETAKMLNLIRTATRKPTTQPARTLAQIALEDYGINPLQIAYPAFATDASTQVATKSFDFTLELSLLDIEVQELTLTHDEFLGFYLPKTSTTSHRDPRSELAANTALAAAA